MNLVKKHQHACKGQAVELRLYFVRLQRQMGTHTSGSTNSFSSDWGGNTWNTFLTNLETKVWGQTRSKRDHLCMFQMWITWGRLEIGFKTKFEQKGAKCLKRERLGNAELAFSRQLGREFGVCVRSLLSYSCSETVSEAEVIEFSLNPSYMQRLFLL